MSVTYSGFSDANIPLHPYKPFITFWKPQQSPLVIYYYLLELFQVRVEDREFCPSHMVDCLFAMMKFNDDNYKLL